MKISQLESGMQVWSVTRTKMGNTALLQIVGGDKLIIPFC